MLFVLGDETYIRRLLCASITAQCLGDRGRSRMVGRGEFASEKLRIEGCRGFLDSSLRLKPSFSLARGSYDHMEVHSMGASGWRRASPGSRWALDGTSGGRDPIN